MRKFFFFFFFATLTSFAQAQISDEEAKQIYQDAEEQYEAGSFYNSYTICYQLKEKMEKWTPKTLYLLIKSIYNNLESSKDKSEEHIKKSYENYSIFSKYSNDFFQLIDKTTYPTEKYNEILQIHQYFEQGLKNYEYEKNRKPEDAINFLNECAAKFKRTKKDITSTDNWETSYSLHDSTLQIDIFIQSRNTAARFNNVQRERILIDLSKAWFEDRGFEKVPYSNNQRMGLYIVSTKSFKNKYEVYDNIIWYDAKHYIRSLEYPLQEFEQQLNGRGGYGSRYVQDGYRIYYTFDEFSNEFISDYYYKRIFDAFEFLINYYGGGTPQEKKQETKSKF
ncbi:hypothetical protein EJV47_17765 [Hymenobacter gummosus]|uniref:Uncharacterized protein n=1 Tax=Hymenobacter gummosus TaxID=1776032 RepID=A0A3S0JF86_9BACT|nr:hypothetical protein [Hymenobacter gummosus]RTQ47768.1 hypothetical protein EJV47_17765 [Hymenobacter gummosus]